jgi:3-isopropylmalate/(R)-2-methylmalate dehydratase small subunit
MNITGRVWKFGDDINTDLILPSSAISLSPEEQARYVFSSNRPGWSSEVEKGDVIIAGSNFGTGSSRPAARAMLNLGIGCVLAESISGLFFRNCVNTPLCALEVPGIFDAFEENDIAEIDFECAIITNKTTNKVIKGVAWPRELLEIYHAGGIIPLLRSRGLLID